MSVCLPRVVRGQRSYLGIFSCSRRLCLLSLQAEIILRDGAAGPARAIRGKPQCTSGRITFWMRAAGLSHSALSVFVSAAQASEALHPPPLECRRKHHTSLLDGVSTGVKLRSHGQKDAKRRPISPSVMNTSMHSCRMKPNNTSHCVSMRRLPDFS